MSDEADQSGSTRTRFEVPFMCSDRHERAEVVVKVQTLIVLSSGEETSAPGRGGRDVPPGRPVPPLRGVPLDRQRAKYEMKCSKCHKRYELRPEKAEQAVAAALESGASWVDLKSVAG